LGIKKWIYILFGFLYFFSGNLHSQSYDPIGQHFLYSVSAKQYKSNPQNFDLLQGDNNLMYFANAGGILEFDGESWRTIKIPTQKTYCLDKNKEGVIYAGATDNFGYLSPNEKGELTYFSLSDKNKKEKTPTILDVICADGWVYFFPDRNLANNYIFAYSEKEKKSYKVVTPFKIVFQKKSLNKIIIQLDDNFIYTLKENNLQQISSSEKWKEVNVRQILDINQSSFVYDGEKLFSVTRNWEEPVLFPDIHLMPNLNNLIYFKNKIITASKSGIFVCDNTGKLLFPLNKNVGLIDNNVNKLFIDKEENLWAATENGISVIDVNNTLTYYNFSDGIDGAVVSIGNYKNNLIVETKSGVFELKKQIEAGENIAFEKLSAITNSPYGLTQFQEGSDTVLFIADFDGILKRTGLNNFERILSCAPWDIVWSKKNKNRLLIPDYTSGIILLEFQNGQYAPLYIDELNNVSGRQVFEDENGDFWLSSETNGIYHIQEKKTDKPEFKITFYNEKNGLPEGFTFAFRFNHTLYFATESGFYEKTEEKFVKSNLLKMTFAQKYTIHRAKTDTQGNLWVSAYDANDIKKYFTGYARIKNDKLYWIRKPFFKASEEKLDCFFHQNESTTWFGGPDGLFRFDKRNPENFSRKYELLLRKFTRNDDELLFGGAGNFDETNFVFSFDESKYYFEFAAAHFKTENGIRYSFFLEGQDKTWSKYTSQNHIEFRNLYEGKYTLNVKAIDDFGNVSKVFKIHFEIEAPVYRTFWAYIVYVVLFVLIIIGAVRISSNGLKKIIKQRTREIEEQKHIVEEKNKEIIDSISYAKRLQQAILPSQKFIHENLNDTFILYKPKDIVAGDFYWMEKVGDWVLFAVCDCTGHGVPGAMVSVVGANSLNRCVNEFKLVQPAKILDKLTQLVEETFSQNESEVRDGMDMSICALNTKTLELHWAGANNPIWYIKNNELAEIKADKQPIGKYENRKPFTHHSVQLQTGDRIYLFTDGYADQFGGEKGKKFKYSQLKETILSYSFAPLDEQNKKLDEIFEKWKTNMEQTDDVCLWGVKV
jgi:serine phosphatase RsbU (regulator of sigma subunit)